MTRALSLKWLRVFSLQLRMNVTWGRRQIFYNKEPFFSHTFMYMYMYSTYNVVLEMLCKFVQFITNRVTIYLTISWTWGTNSEAGSTPMVTFINSSVARTTSLDLDDRNTHVLDSNLFISSAPSRSVHQARLVWSWQSWQSYYRQWFTVKFIHKSG